MSDTLRTQGVAIWDGALAPALASAIHDEVLAIHVRGGFLPARVGRAPQVQTAIRSDEIFWLLPARAADDAELFSLRPGLTALRQLLFTLADHLSEQAFVRLDGVEMMASHYPRGAFYVPHVDRFSESAERFFTFVYFLNPAWTEGDGGMLSIHGDDAQSIAPLLGRLVVFHTPELLHEVTKTLQGRFAVTGWLGKAARA